MRIGWKRGYKVLETYGNLTPRSLFRGIWEGGVGYPLNEIVHPRKGCGPLTLFKNLKGADYLLSHCQSPAKPRIFPCEYFPSKERSVWSSTFKVLIRKLESRNSTILQKGSTVLADAIIVRSPHGDGR